MAIMFTGTPSILSRTIFVDRGTMTKPPIPVVYGTDLEITGSNTVKIQAGGMLSSYVGYTLTISGAANSVNNGTYLISEVRNGQTLRLADASFDTIDVATTTNRLVALTNDIRKNYLLHLSANDVHYNDDTVYTSIPNACVNLGSAIPLLNALKAKLVAHAGYVNVVGLPHGGYVHRFEDPLKTVYTKDVNASTDSAGGLYNAIVLANELRRRFETHRLTSAIHQNDDFLNRIQVAPVRAAKLSLSGLTWVISDPRHGQLADDPSDVNVWNGTVPVPIEMVSGELGAIVLSSTPPSSSTFTCDYYSLINPPLSITRLNNFGFNLNQEKNRGYSGFPSHTRRQRSFLLNSRNPGQGIKSPYLPKRIGYKYKGIRSEGSALLNDPTSLLLNAPTNRITYPIKTEVVQESTVNYDSYVLPTSYPDPWTLNGSGTIALNTSLNTLDIQDTSTTFYLNPGPPFYSHPIDLRFTSSVYSAFRCWAELSDLYTLNGHFAGVGFGITNGERAALVGFLAAPANNLSTAISLLNQIKSKISAHFVNTGVHIPNDTIDVIARNDARDFASAVSLLEFLVQKYEAHRIRAPYDIHVAPDTTNTITYDKPTTEQQLVDLVNTFASVINAHLVEAGVHFLNDSDNTVTPVLQVGLYRSGGFFETVDSWETFAHDWTSETTYRLHIDDNGLASVRLSGDIEARVDLAYSDQAAAAEVNLRLDPLNQVVFGAFGNGSTSLSHWKLVRCQIVPQLSTQVGQNKVVAYESSSSKVPSDASPPWIDVGQGGADYIYANTLFLDSTSYVSESDAEAAGVLTGEFKGYVRPEFTLTDRNLLITKFNLACPRYSFGIDNTSATVRIADGQFSTLVCLLNYDPIAASVIGSNQTPGIAINAGDTLELAIDGGDPVIVTFPAAINSTIYPSNAAQAVANVINTAIAGVASSTATSTPGYSLVLMSPTTGAHSSINIVGGTALGTLGLLPGTIYGQDSQPLTKIGWSGVNLPNLAPDQWVSFGTQPATMLDREIEILDTSVDDFLKYAVEGTDEAVRIFDPSKDWSAEFRVHVTSFIPASPVSNIAFCGCLFGIDEGNASSGKNLEVHLVKKNGTPGVQVYSYDQTTDQLLQVAYSNFDWTKGPHTFTLTKTSSTSTISLQVDGQLLISSISLSGLQTGTVAGIKWGSGDLQTGNIDRTAAQSTSVWSSISAIAAPSAGATKKIGIYRGGDPNALDSYYTADHDWSNPTDYLLIRDPVAGVSVKIGTNPIPVINTTYDALTVPLVATDLLSGLIPSGKYIAFGSFNPHEIVRTKWTEVKYTVGRLTSQSEFVKCGQVLNRANVVSSSEHLRTPEAHDHFGTRIYSGGSPADDFVADPNIPAALVLNEDTPTFEQTQSLSALGGLVPNVSVISDPIDLMTSHGNVAGYENDPNAVATTPVTTYAEALQRTIEFTQTFLNHISSKKYHKNINRAMVAELEQILEELTHGS